MPKKKSSGEKPVSKTKFVLDLPANTPAEEVVTKAAASGLTLSKAYVYTIRANSKRAGKKAKRAAGAAPKASSSKATTASASTGSPKSNGALDTQFVTFIAEIGLVRAEELMKSVRAKFRSAAV